MSLSLEMLDHPRVMGARDRAQAIMDRRARGSPISDVLARIDAALALPEIERDAMLEAM